MPDRDEPTPIADLLGMLTPSLLKIADEIGVPAITVRKWAAGVSQTNDLQRRAALRAFARAQIKRIKAAMERLH